MFLNMLDDSVEADTKYSMSPFKGSDLRGIMFLFYHFSIFSLRASVGSSVVMVYQVGAPTTPSPLPTPSISKS
jgi:hypothetical protein